MGYADREALTSAPRLPLRLPALGREACGPAVSPVTLGRPGIIIAVRNADRIARQNTKRFVLDRSCSRVFFDGEIAQIGSTGRPGGLFTVCAALLCARGDVLSHERLFELLWGDQADGGPDYPMSTMYRFVCIAQPFLDWAGISVHARHGFHDWEVRPLGWRQPRPGGFVLRMDDRAASHPRLGGRA